MTKAWIAALLAMAAAMPLSAQSSPAIRSAKAAGQVGERYDGFLGYASYLPAAVRREVETVNIRRRAHYSKLAASRGVSPQEVGITAGCQLLARVAVGEAYLLPGNAWRRRGAGQPPPVPNYCRA